MSLTPPRRHAAVAALLAPLALLAAGGAAAQQRPAGPQAEPPKLPASGTIPLDTARERRVLEQVKVAEGFELALFASPPVAMYPTCLTSAPDGAVYVCVDPNLSLSTGKGRGRVMRVVDENGDGRGDRYTTFAEMDSPRGVVADGRTVFVMAPPNLTAYRDTNGDGIADSTETLVQGLGFDLDFRGADHATNGITLGIDGWLYVAVGDYGFLNARGRDGTTLKHRGGSVVRVRTDGSGLELYAVGTRNIYDVAVSPMLEVFTRDNTNDGDGWDTRLHYIAQGANLGYPALYKNFADEHFPSLADYGAGSGTAGLWVHDPGWPEGFGNTLYTGDWTRNRVYRHALKPQGASFAIEQDELLTISHPADMFMDGRSNMFVASLAGGTFTYAGDTVGYVLRVRPKGAPAAEAGQALARLGDGPLVAELASPHADRRLWAQREILRRGDKRGIRRDIERLVLDAGRPAWARVAAMFTLKQLRGEDANETIRRAVGDTAVRALALRALADDPRQRKDVSLDLFTRALADSDLRVRMQAVAGLARLGAVEAADPIVQLTAHDDRALAHVATSALVTLGARDALFRALDAGTAPVRAGALRALQQMHDSATVSGLLARLDRPGADPAMRTGILGALARLQHREAEWTGGWWGTRPFFAGPYFAASPWAESPRIAPALRRELAAARGETAGAIVDVYAKNRVLPTGARPILLAAEARGDAVRGGLIEALIGTPTLTAAVVPLLAGLDTTDADMHRAVAELLAGETTVPTEALPLLRRAALDTTLDAAVRQRVLVVAGRQPGPEGLRAATEIMATVNPTAGGPEAVEQIWRRYVGDRARLQEIDYFIELSRNGRPAEQTLAYAVLVQSVRGNRTPAPVRAKVTPVIDAGWSNPSTLPSLTQAITLVRADSLYRRQIDSVATAAAQRQADSLRVASAGTRPARPGTGAPNNSSSSRPGVPASGPAGAPGTTASAPATAPATAPRPAPLPAAVRTMGQRVYGTACAACHQPTGEGGEMYPPLKGSEWVTGSESRLVRVLLHGLQGEIEVAGETYNGVMPPWAGMFNDAEIAAVASYIRNTWGNAAPPVSAATVARIRAEHAARKTPWTAAELPKR